MADNEPELWNELTEAIADCRTKGRALRAEWEKCEHTVGDGPAFKALKDATAAEEEAQRRYERAWLNWRSSMGRSRT